MAQAVSAPHKRGFLSTLRTDTWWLGPGLYGLFMAAGFGWLTISIFLDQWAFEVGPYISPVFEPKFFEASKNWVISPALIVLVGPIPFRATCYYYRKSYYRSWFMSPPACAVGDIGGSYKGESRLPFWVMNLHRFAMYAALVFVPILWIGAVRGFYNTHGVIDGETVDKGFGVGLGSFILVVNAFLLMMYTFSCHSLRHFVGGGLNCFSCSSYAKTRKRLWDYVTSWNKNHNLFASFSLAWIVFTDLYVRLVANDVISDPNTWGF